MDKKIWYEELTNTLFEGNVQFSFPNEDSREVRVINKFIEETRQQAKKEVFDDIDEMWKRNAPIHPVYHQEFDKLKKRHLSTSQSKGTELSSSGSLHSPKDCYNMNCIYLCESNCVWRYGLEQCKKRIRNPSDD